MEKIIKNVRSRFIATIILVVVFVVATSWGILQLYNTQEIASPATVAEIHSPASENEAFGEYLENQKEFEAHFITLASSIKQQESDRITRGLAITSVIAVVLGVIVAVFAAKRLMRPVVEAYESQERFLQDAAHEFRNPLAAMTAALQQTKEKSPLVDTFRRQTNRLVNINEDLLFLEQRQAQKIELLNLSELLSDVVEEIQPIAIKKRVAIEMKTGPSVLKKMSSSDYVRLTKNIIGNAVKYSREKSVVKITQRKVKNNIIIVIKDSGIGIPPKELEHIGKRFFRASNTGKVSGTGLGLAIAHKILNTYNGDIVIQSVYKKGTKITISLPA